jgi:hypothetical protein
MLKTAGFVFAVIAVGTVAIAWTQTRDPAAQPAPQAETIVPEHLMAGRGPLPDQQFKDMTFVHTDND